MKKLLGARSLEAQQSTVAEEHHRLETFNANRELGAVCDVLFSYSRKGVQMETDFADELLRSNERS